MFEDEMTESDIVRDESEYLKVTEQERWEEEFAQAKAIASGLIGWAAALASPSQEADRENR